MPIQAYSGGVNFSSQAASAPSTISKTSVSQNKFFQSSSSEDSDGDSLSGAASPVSSDASPMNSPMRSSLSKADGSPINRKWDSRNKTQPVVLFEGDSEGDSYDSDRSCSPKQCSSPISTFNNAFDGLSMGDSLMPKQSEVIYGAIEKLKSLEDPSTKNDKVKIILKKLFKKLSDGDTTPNMRSPTAQRKVHSNLVESPWAPRLANECRAILRNSLSGKRTLSENNLLLPIVNLKHIVEGEEKNKKIIGCHFCPQGSPLRESLVKERLNPANGIFCGEIVKAERKEPKFSSFFPESIKTQAELLNLIHTAKQVMAEGNRSLYLTDKGFMIEVYLKEHGLVFHSAFPIFYYGEYKEGEQYILTKDIFFKSEEIYAMAESLIRSQGKTDNENPIRYSTHMVVDIAPALEKETGIKSGVFIRFPSSAFANLD